MKMDESGWNGWKLMKVDGSGWKWMAVDEMDENGWKWMKMDENWWKLMKMDENGWKWTIVDVTDIWLIYNWYIADAVTISCNTRSFTLQSVPLSLDGNDSCKLSCKFTCSLRNLASTSSSTSAAAFLFTFSCIDFYDQQRKYTLTHK